jgi:hypothetical protein
VNTTRVRFWAKGGTNYSLIVGTMSNPLDASTFTAIETVNPPATYTQYTVSFASYTGTNHYIAFKHGSTATYQGIYIDDVNWQMIPTGAQIDMLTNSIAYGEVYQNAMASQPLVIANSGLATLTVNFAPSSPQITTDVTGPISVAPGANQTINVRITPVFADAFAGTLILNSNDPQTPAYTVNLSATVLPPLPVGLIEIGNGTVVNQSLPVEPFYNYSYSQTIYLQSELNQPNGQISSIAYKYNGGGTTPTAWSDSVYIWMGHTAQSAFASTTDWLPVNNMTLVYSGMLTVLAEPGWVTIPLNAPFAYDNVNNLVVAVDRNMPPYHGTTCDFYCTASTAGRSIDQHSDTVNQNPADPTTAGTLRAYIPNTRLQFLPTATVPIFSATPNPVNFGSVSVATPSAVQNVVIRNAGGGTDPLIIPSAITLTGPNASQFTMTDTNTYPKTLAAGQSMTVSLVFTPTSGGTKTAQLNITDNLTASRESTRENSNTRTAHIIPVSGLGNDGIWHDFPMVQDFENAQFPSNSWTVLDSQNPSAGWRRRTTTENIHTGLGYGVAGIVAGNHWLISPKMEISTQSNTLRFWMKDNPDVADTVQASLNENIRILVSTGNPADTTSFTTQLQQWTNFDLPSTYSTDPTVIDLSAYVGQNISIAFVRHSLGGKFIHLDDVSISTSSGLVFYAPTALQYSLSGSVVTLTWTAPTPAPGTHLTGYKVYRGAALLETVTTATYTDNPTPGTTQEYTVVAVYQEGESAATMPVTVEVPGVNPNTFVIEGFESYADFSQNFGHFTSVDGDQATTYSFDNVTYPGATTAKGFMVFNPSATTPAMNMQPHSGNKMAVSFDSNTNPPSATNDWLISPRMHLGTESVMKVWARSFTDTWGAEKMHIAISTTNNTPASFTNLTTLPISVPASGWTEYVQDLSAYNNQDVYLAIRCITQDALALMIDDLSITSVGGTVANDDPLPQPTQNALLGNYPNPFNPETTISFDLQKQSKVKIEIFNTRGQKVKTLVNEIRSAGHHTAHWSGKDEIGRNVTSGVYFYKMQAGTYSSTKKMILLR